MKKELDKIRKFKYEISFDNVDNQIWKFNEEFVEWELRDEMCDYLTLDDAKHLFVLLGKYITAVEMRIWLRRCKTKNKRKCEKLETFHTGGVVFNWESKTTFALYYKKALKCKKYKKIKKSYWRAFSYILCSD